VACDAAPGVAAVEPPGTGVRSGDGDDDDAGVDVMAGAVAAGAVTRGSPAPHPVRTTAMRSNAIGTAAIRRGVTASSYRPDMTGPRRAPARRGPVADEPAHQALRRGRRRPYRSSSPESSRAPRRETFDGSAHAAGRCREHRWKESEDQEDCQGDHARGAGRHGQSSRQLISHGPETPDPACLLRGNLEELRQNSGGRPGWVRRAAGTASQDSRTRGRRSRSRR